MRIAYAILAHRNPDQLARLIRALEGPEIFFCIHIDRAEPIEPFQRAVQTLHGVHFVMPRVRTRLFSFRIVQATLRCFELALAKDADIIVLLSGQDYPLQPTSEIRAFFDSHPGRQFIDHHPVGPDFWAERVDHFHFTTVRPVMLQRAMNRIARSLPRRRRRIPIHGGSAWVSVTGSFARHLIEQLGRNTRFSRLFRFAHNPDEMAIQTVAMNSDFAATVINDNLHHIRWRPGATHPDTFMDDDFDELMRSGKLFARKFDAAETPALLDRIDGLLQATGRSPAGKQEERA